MTAPATILVDLRVAQINGDRGIPAYSQSLTLELSRGFPRHHWLLLYDRDRPPSARADELAAHARWCTAAELDRPDIPPIDVLFTGCFFFVPHKGSTADSLIPPAVRRHRPRHMGIVYDLIPLLFPDRYLTNETARGSYFEALEILRGCDHLFAISQASRQDTIRLAALDPRRVHCVYGDIDHAKQELMARPHGESAGMPAAHGLVGPYCVYVGGDDWRKNLDRTVQAFAIFHRTHPSHQLAIVCKLSPERIATLLEVATAAGLPDGAVVCTGRVSDEALVGLVRHAEMLVFASLYEGLGLPILEAYGCGTPVVGSNTSSVAELVLPELACNPHEPASIAAAMARLTAHSPLRDASLAFGRRLIAEELGWARAAEKVIERIEERPVPHVPSSLTQGHREAARTVAIVTGSPSASVGLSATLRESLGSPAWVQTLYHARQRPLSTIDTASRHIPIEALPAALIRGRHALVIFVLEQPGHDGMIADAIFRTRRAPARRVLGIATTWLDQAIQESSSLGALRQLLERGEIDSLVIESETDRERLQTGLGGFAENLAVDIGFPTPSMAIGAAPTGQDTAGACSLGAA